MPVDAWPQTKRVRRQAAPERWRWAGGSVQTTNSANILASQSELSRQLPFAARQHRRYVKAMPELTSRLILSSTWEDPDASASPCVHRAPVALGACLKPCGAGRSDGGRLDVGGPDAAALDGAADPADADLPVLGLPGRRAACARPRVLLGLAVPRPAGHHAC